MRAKIRSRARTPKTVPSAMESLFLWRAAELSVDEVADATILSVVVELEDAWDGEGVVEDDAGLMSV